MKLRLTIEIGKLFVIIFAEFAIEGEIENATRNLRREKKRERIESNSYLPPVERAVDNVVIS